MIKSRLQAEVAELSKLTGMENYPEYRNDFDIVGDFSQRYGNSGFVVQRPELVADFVREDSQGRKELRPDDFLPIEKAKSR